MNSSRDAGERLVEDPRSLMFREIMKGCIVSCSEQGMNTQIPCSSAFEIKIIDLDTFLGDSHVAAVVEGSLHCSYFGGECIIKEGTFNCLIDVIPKQPYFKDMRYRLFLLTPSGRELSFVGTKYVDRNRKWHVWRDTTTLVVKIYDGYISEDAEHCDMKPLATGVLRISFFQFVRLLLSIRSNGPTRVSQLVALVDFITTFASRLWEIYRPIPRARMPLV